MIRVLEYTLTINPGEDAVLEAELVKYHQPTASWENYGKITTTNPSQMQGLTDWYSGQNVMTEDELFGRKSAGVE